MLGHHNVANQSKVKTFPRIIKEPDKGISCLRGSKKGPALVATAGDVMKVSAVVDSAQPVSHRRILQRTDRAHAPQKPRRVGHPHSYRVLKSSQAKKELTQV